ncbi:YfhD family protein [Paenibacillus alkalitolerans]|uniref:YfhD family protein n=1 Tax=Paenibacillus alkalitolerans TaxID=2799335 RepID=UPI0018F79907|nr:YfhD family protein [Paenibacillus alkalitolerans]
MARGQNRRTVDNNESQMPQSPKYEIRKRGDDIEIAQELGDRYKIEQKPGFPPTGVTRKDRE